MDKTCHFKSGCERNFVLQANTFQGLAPKSLTLNSYVFKHIYLAMCTGKMVFSVLQIAVPIKFDQ